MVVVNSASELTSELNSATGGETIELAAGVNFGDFETPGSKTYSTQITVQSLNDSNRGVFSKLTVRSGNVKFKNITVDYTFTSGDSITKESILVGSASGSVNDIEFDGLRAIGDTNTGGYPNGKVFWFYDDSDNIIVRNSVCNGFESGLLMQDGSNFQGINNEWYGFGSDIWNFAATDTILIEYDYAHDWVQPNPGAHIDWVQLLHSLVNNHCQDVTVRYCVVDQGAGFYQQVFWVAADGFDISNPIYRHKRITLHDNIFISGHVNGLGLAGVDDVNIHHNGWFVGPPSTRDSVPNINFLDVDTPITFTDNIHPGYVNAPGAGTVSNNFTRDYSDFGGDLTLLKEGIADGYHDIEIKTGTTLHTALAGPRIMKRAGDWGGNGVEPHADYPGGFQASGGSPASIGKRMAGISPLMGNGVPLLG